MKQYTFTGKLIDYKHLNCSCYGNPAYYGIFENASGERLAGRTASNAACAYGFLNRQHEIQTVIYHITRTGNIIIDYLR